MSARLSLVFAPRTSGSGSAPRTPAGSQLCVHLAKACPASEPPWTPPAQSPSLPLSPSSPHPALGHSWAVGPRSSFQARPSGRPWTRASVLGAVAGGAPAGGPGPALAQSQGASPAREEGSLGFCSRVSGDKSQVGQGDWRLSRRPCPRGRMETHRCGRAPAEGPELGRPGLGPAPPSFSRPHLALCEVTFSRKPEGCGFPPVSPSGLRAPPVGPRLGNRLRGVA